MNILLGLSIIILGIACIVFYHAAKMLKAIVVYQTLIKAYAVKKAKQEIIEENRVKARKIADNVSEIIEKYRNEVDENFARKPKDD